MDFCPVCHSLDLRDPDLQIELSDESIEAGLYLSGSEDDADFNILGEELQPNNPRLQECDTCLLISDLLSQLDPVLSVVTKWKNTEIYVGIEAAKNVQLYVDTQNLMPGRRYYELYTPTGVLYPFYRHGQNSEDLELYPGSRKLWNQLKQWLIQCGNEHEQCNIQRVRWNPTRLVKVEQDRLHLVMTADLTVPSDKQEVPPLKYVALSHCWGMEQPLRTLSDNLQQHLFDIAWDRLPRVFQDSLTAIRELGLTYIWIDSLCIIQDDRDDWAREAQMMGDVYEQAYLTISATACENGMVPFLGPEAPGCELRIPTTPRNERIAGPLRSLKARRMPDSMAYQGPIMNRAWTLQERFFSNRIIHFTHFQTQWKCKQTRACESDMNRPTASSNNYVVKANRDPLNKWNTLVREYSDLSITRASDKLPALAGLAGHFHPKIKSLYIAGLWQTRLPEQLAWSMAVVEPQSQDLLPETGASLMTNRPPSWSWASITGSTFSWVPKVSRIHIDIIETVCQPATANKFGEVESGSLLRLDCQLCPVDISYDPGKAFASERYTFSISGHEEKIRIFPDCLLETAGEPAWVARAADKPDDLRDRVWSAAAMLMPLIAERDTPPGCLLLGKKAGDDQHTFHRVGQCMPLVDEQWRVFEPHLQAAKIIFK